MSTCDERMLIFVHVVSMLCSDISLICRICYYTGIRGKDRH